MSATFILLLVIPAFAAVYLFFNAQSAFADKYKLGKWYVRVGLLLCLFIAFILANAFYFKWFAI